MSGFLKLIDAGRASCTLSVDFGCSRAHQNDEAVVAIGYLDEQSLPMNTGYRQFLSLAMYVKETPFQFQSGDGLIRVGTRIIKVYMAAYIYEHIDQQNRFDNTPYCAFDYVKLFIFSNSIRE